MEPERGEWVSIGAHRYRLEAPDIFWSEMHGELTIAQLDQLYDVVRAYSARLGTKVFWLSVVRDAGTMSHDARKHAAKSDLQGVLAGTVMVGASFQLRVIINFITTAATILQPSRKGAVPTYCVDTEAEARAYIDEIRKKR